MKNINIYFIIVICASFYLLYNNLALKKGASKLTHEIDKFKNEISINTEYELSAIKHSSKIKINTDVQILNKNYDLVHIDSIFKAPTLILRIPSAVCNPCYDSIYGTINKVIPDTSKFRLRIIVDDKTLNDYKTYFNELGLIDNVFGILKGSLISEVLDNQPFPYFALKTKNGSLNYLFVVNKDSDIRLNKYLQIIKTKLGDKPDPLQSL